MIDGGHHFRQLRWEIIRRSVSQAWETAKLEWSLRDIYEAEDGPQIRFVDRRRPDKMDNCRP
jgi:hypothetical protein